MTNIAAIRRTAITALVLVALSACSDDHDNARNPPRGGENGNTGLKGRHTEAQPAWSRTLFIVANDGAHSSEPWRPGNTGAETAMARTALDDGARDQPLRFNSRPSVAADESDGYGRGSGTVFGMLKARAATMPAAAPAAAR